jgi:iron complex outermembrane receptor protein
MGKTREIAHIKMSLRVSSALCALMIAGSAYAQEAQGTADSDKTDNSEIVVTGTLVRGIAPAGTNVVAVSAENIKETGAATVSQLLQTVPQFGSFNDLQAPTGGGNFVTTNRPNLRNLPGFTTTGGSSTLMLVDGQRVVGMGISSTTPDADFIPPGILERVEIVPDGGSAIYGSDAVAGVINFITAKRFDGIKVDARYGFGNDYHTFDANATVGKNWGTGGIWLSYNYTENNTFYGRDRDYVFVPRSTVSGIQAQTLACPTPNLQVSLSAGTAATLYSSPNPASINSVNFCDESDGASIYPAQKRHSVYAGLNQELSDSIEFNLRAFYYNKQTELSIGNLSGTVNLGPSFLSSFGYAQSPYFVNVTGSPGEVQTVNYQIGPDGARRQRVSLSSWGVTPSFTFDIGGGWQVRTSASYSESTTVQHSAALAPASVIRPLVNAGTFNPYMPGSISAGTYAAMSNYEVFGDAKQRMFNVRAIVDGSLFALPGGDAKVAVGVEYNSQGYAVRKGSIVPGTENALTRFNLSRNFKSAFGEIVLPVFDQLTISASGRYDSYSDAGDTFNPKFGATFKPVEWLKIRGAWGKSFVAPSLADNSVADPTNLNWVSGATFNFVAPTSRLNDNGYPTPLAGQYMAFLLGSTPGLTPQKATTWSLGFDIDPPFVPGLHLTGTYYNINYTDLIQQVPFINTTLYWSTYAPTTFTLAPNSTQLAAINPVIVTGTPCAPLPTCVYGIQDVRKRNLGGFKQSGLDFGVNYQTATGFGSIDFGVSGTYILTRANKATPISNYVSELPTMVSRLKMRSNIGATVGNLRGQFTWNHSAGFNVPPVPIYGQTRVGAYNTFDLFFKYDVPGDSMAFKDLSLTLNVTNLFDKDPPLYFAGNIVANASGFLNGNTVGRLVQLGVSKRF